MEQSEIIGRAVLLARGVVNADQAAADLTTEEWRLCLRVAVYECERISQDANGAQRVAMRLLRSILPADMLSTLRRRVNSFEVEGSAGGRYRLWPRGGAVERIERHGSKWWAVEQFCYHEVIDELPMPPADRSIAHMLILVTDEPRFLAEANMTRRTAMWDGSWRRQLNAARRERAA